MLMIPHLVKSFVLIDRTLVAEIRTILLVEKTGPQKTFQRSILVYQKLKQAICPVWMHFKTLFTFEEGYE